MRGDSPPPIRRLTLIPSSPSDESVRRYRLAQLDELALATPPTGADAATGRPPPEKDEEADRPSAA